jgi:hypothetical protein
MAGFSKIFTSFLSFAIPFFLFAGCTGESPFGINFSGKGSISGGYEQKEKNNTQQNLTIAGTWSITQSNNEYGTITFLQSGNILSGTSSFETHSNGPVKGEISGAKVTFTIYYPENVSGIYYGTLSDDGLTMTGTGVSSTNSTATWKARKIF